MDEEDEAPDPFSSLESAPIADVARIAPGWLADADTQVGVAPSRWLLLLLLACLPATLCAAPSQIPATKRLLDRLRLGSDPETDARTVLRLLCSHVAPH